MRPPMPGAPESRRPRRDPASYVGLPTDLLEVPEPDLHLLLAASMAAPTTLGRRREGALDGDSRLMRALIRDIKHL